MTLQGPKGARRRSRSDVPPLIRHMVFRPLHQLVSGRQEKRRACRTHRQTTHGGNCDAHAIGGGLQIFVHFRSPFDPCQCPEGAAWTNGKGGGDATLAHTPTMIRTLGRERSSLCGKGLETAVSFHRCKERTAGDSQLCKRVTGHTHSLRTLDEGIRASVIMPRRCGDRVRCDSDRLSIEAPIFSVVRHALKSCTAQRYRPGVCSRRLAAARAMRASLACRALYAATSSGSIGLVV